jgi:hypothetical protein
VDRAQGGIKLQRGSPLVKGTENGLDDEGDCGAGQVYSPRAPLPLDQSVVTEEALIEWVHVYGGSTLRLT